MAITHRKAHAKCPSWPRALRMDRLDQVNELAKRINCPLRTNGILYSRASSQQNNGLDAGVKQQRKFHAVSPRRSQHPAGH